MIPLEERERKLREGSLMIKMTQTSLLIIFDIDIIFLSLDFKTNRLMREVAS
jgi:hypothetical protein